MLKNYLKIAFRNLLKNKAFSVINILGLSIGMAACFYIFQYIHFESSYDRFHKNKSGLYRISMSYTGSLSNGHTTVSTHPAIGPAMKADFPEVKDFARIAPPSTFMKTSTFSYTDDEGNAKRFNEKNFYLADGPFLTMFSFPFVKGNPATALVRPKSIVISETTAKKYFGDIDPLDKLLHVNNSPLTVTGVFRDIPENSHIKFDMLISLNSTEEKFGYEEWGWPEFYNYILLAPGTDPQKVEAKFPAFIEKYLGKRMKEMKFENQLHLQRVTDIHLKSDYGHELEANGSEKIIYFLSILGIFILGIAWINYINLSTAKSLDRAREVGMRKVVGASRAQLSWQFIFESVIINCIALFLAAIIVFACAPLVEHFVGKKINTAFLTSGLWKQWQFWLILVSVFIAGALQVGAYPAFILSSFRPVQVLKGSFQHSNRGTRIRKVLVGFQFILSIILIGGTVIVYSQLSYMRNIDPGYDKDQILVVKAPAIVGLSYSETANYFKTQVLKNPAINHIAPSTEIPGKSITALNAVRRVYEDKTHNFITALVEVDKDFVPTYNLKLVAGTNLPDQEPEYVFEAKKTKVLINEEIVKGLGFKSNEDALHQTVVFVSYFGDIKGEVVGVVKNFHQRSLKVGYAPMLFYHNNRSNWGYFSINLHAKDARHEMAFIEEKFNQSFPGNAFESFFLDDFFDRQYQADQKFGNIFGLFTILAIFIACMGLMGLSIFAIKVRTREMGIRKVLGASTKGIIYLFSKDFIKLVSVAAIVATPVIYILADDWLNNFAFHIQLKWFFFILSPLVLLVIALITISLQSFSIAFKNPVDCLRND